MDLWEKTEYTDYPITQRISKLSIFPNKINYFNYIDDVELL